MYKLLVISDSAAAAVMKAEKLGLNREDIKIVNRAESIYGCRGMLMVMAGEPYKLDDFQHIMDYADTHDIKALRFPVPV